MSSDYDVLCLSHTPATVIETGEGRGQPHAAIEAIQTGMPGHPECDLLVGRWSGALIEIACVGGDFARAHHSGWHRDVIWAPTGLLLVAALAVDLTGNARIEAAVKQLPMCWTPARLRSLRERLVGGW